VDQQQKLAFRLLFTIGGGILVLSVYGNFGLSVLMYPLLQALADWAASSPAVRACTWMSMAALIPWRSGATTWVGFWWRW